jgi:hypothetical protein
VELVAAGRAAPGPAAVDLAVLAAFGLDGDRAVPSTWSSAEIAAAARLLADRYANPAWHADPAAP